MTTELLNSPVSARNGTIDEEGGPVPRSCKTPLVFDLIGSVLAVLFFVGTFLAFKLCLETAVPFITHDIAAQAEVVRGP